MALGAGYLEMFAVIELAANQPAIRNEGMAHQRCAIFGGRHFMAIGAARKTRGADLAGSGHLRHGPGVRVAEENSPFEFFARTVALADLRHLRLHKILQRGLLRDALLPRAEVGILLGQTA